MWVSTQLLFHFFRKYRKDKADSRAAYIFYKIIDSNNQGKYLLQCINTKAIFQISMTDMVFDITILYGLHPIQSCYIGIEYAKTLIAFNGSAESPKNRAEDLPEHPASRYGRYAVCYQDRKGKICFVDKKTTEKIVMDPRDIALTEELIQHFDAVQSFYIGLLAGLKLHNPEGSFRRPHLTLIKS